MTIKQAKAILTPLGITLRKNEHAEFVVRIKGAPSGHGYFADDLADAVETGKLMSERHFAHIERFPQAKAEMEYEARFGPSEE